MKKNLMRHLIETQDLGQTIIIENEIPNLNYKNHGVIVYHFSGKKGEGRYGLLDGIEN